MPDDKVREEFEIFVKLAVSENIADGVDVSDDELLMDAFDRVRAADNREAVALVKDAADTIALIHTLRKRQGSYRLICDVEVEQLGLRLAAFLVKHGGVINVC